MIVRRIGAVLHLGLLAALRVTSPSLGRTYPLDWGTVRGVWRHASLTFDGEVTPSVLVDYMAHEFPENGRPIRRRTSSWRR